MLTDTEKERIKLEESYRSEVKKLFEVQKTLLSKVISFLNSALGLWLLSAIFISGGIKFYEDYKAKQDKKKQLTETVSKLDNEIGYRYSRILANLFELTDKNPDSVALSKKYNESHVKIIALGLDSSRNSSRDFLYTEYSNFGLLTLLSEEKQVLSQLNESTKDIDQVISHITALKVFYEVQNVNFSDVQAVASAIEESLILPRWKKNNFYFLDGTADNPFP